MKKFLLIRTDRIGDVVLTLPMVTLLRERFPDCRITFLGRTYTAPLLQAYQGIDEVLCYQPEDLHRGIKGIWHLAGELRRRRFDAALLFYPRPALTAALALAGIPQTIGPGFRWYSFLLKRRVYEHRKYGKKHELEHNLTLLHTLFPQVGEEITFQFHQQEGEKIPLPEIASAARGNCDYAIIHPGSGGSAPNLTLQQYQQIAGRLLRHTHLHLVISGSAAEKALAEKLLEGLPAERVINAAGKINLASLLPLISQARVFISGSTGPLHLANALGTPVLSFYCPAPPCSPRRWGPYHQQQWVITPAVTPCREGRPKICPHGNCLESLSDATLAEVLDQRLRDLGLWHGLVGKSGRHRRS